MRPAELAVGLELKEEREVDRVALRLGGGSDRGRGTVAVLLRPGMPRQPVAALDHLLLQGFEHREVAQRGATGLDEGVELTHPWCIRLLPALLPERGVQRAQRRQLEAPHRRMVDELGGAGGLQPGLEICLGDQGLRGVAAANSGTASTSM